MFDEKAFETIDAPLMLTDAVPAKVVRIYPKFETSLSYDELAAELSSFFNGDLGADKAVSRNTIKNKWLSREGRITRIYDGLNVPSLKTESGRVTAFGSSSVFEFMLEVHIGSTPYDDYAESVRSRYPAKSIEPAVEQSTGLDAELEGGSMVLHRGSALSRYENIETLPDLPVLPTYRHTSTNDLVDTELAKLDRFMDESAAFDEEIDEELIQQAIARGAKRGVILARVEIAATEKTRRQAVENYGKKHGLEVEPEAS